MINKSNLTRGDWDGLDPIKPCPFPLSAVRGPSNRRYIDDASIVILIPSCPWTTRDPNLSHARTRVACRPHPSFPLLMFLTRSEYGEFLF
jgi:hypothetical protein